MNEIRLKWNEDELNLKCECTCRIWDNC